MKKSILLLITLVTLKTSASDIVIYPTGMATNNLAHNVNCPGDNRWYATYVRSAAMGFGWQTNGAGSYGASITNRTDVHITFTGFNGDSGCGDTNAPITRNPADVKYRWTVWGTNNPPATTNDLPLVLHNFLP